MVEMVLAITITFLMLAGVIQLSILFEARVQFDHACGEAARQYDTRSINTDEEFQTEIWDNLGYFKQFFDKSSIQVTAEEPTDALSSWMATNQKGLGFLDDIFSMAGKAKNLIFNYSGRKWTVTINCNPPVFFALLFPNGVPFQTQLAVLRYPKEN